MPHRFVILLAAFSILNCDGQAAKPTQRIPAVPAGSEAIDRAVERGVGFLISRLSPTGAIIDANGGPRFANTFTGLSFLALVSAGHEPADPTPEGFALRMSEDFLLRDDGVGSSRYPVHTQSSNIFEHSITFIALGELTRFGQSREKRALASQRFQVSVNFISQLRRRKPWGTAVDNKQAVTTFLCLGGWQSVGLVMFEDFGLGSRRAAIDSIIDVYEARAVFIESIEYPRPHGSGPSEAAAALLAMKLRGVKPRKAYAQARTSVSRGALYFHNSGDVMMAWLATLEARPPLGGTPFQQESLNLLRQQNAKGDWSPKSFYRNTLRQVYAPWAGPVYATASSVLALTAADRRLEFLQQKRR